MQSVDLAFVLCSARRKNRDFQRSIGLTYVRDTYDVQGLKFDKDSATPTLWAKRRGERPRHWIFSTMRRIIFWLSWPFESSAKEAPLSTEGGSDLRSTRLKRLLNKNNQESGHQRQKIWLSVLGLSS